MFTIPFASVRRLLGVTLAGCWLSAGAALPPPPADFAKVSVDLASADGAEALEATWRYHDVRIVHTRFRSADAAGQPTGAPTRTYDYEPHAGAADFDDSAWTIVDPDRLDERRGAGKVSFNWYRVRLTIPERIGEFDTRGALVVLETSLDDYAEIWVDGELPRAFGQNGGSMVAGWNAPNRLVIGRGVQPGQQIQLAIFGINGPISGAPTNFIYLRYARLDFYADAERPVALPPHEVNVEVVRLDPAIDGLVPENAKAFKLAEGFTFTEGPVWSPDGELLFSDPNENRIYRYRDQGDAAGLLTVFREPSGYDGADGARFHQPGSNGLAYDREGRLTIDEHGNRRVTRLEEDGTLSVLAADFQGRRLNSPNDLVYKRDGTLYFTDPPFGLPGVFEDPDKQLPFSGVYRLRGGRTELLADELTGPNGLAFSPDERFLYVSNWDPARKVLMRYPVEADGTLGAGTVFFDMGHAPGEEALDGVKVDEHGNVYVSGPGGLWILSGDGRHLGTIKLPRLAANFAFGGADGRMLYLTARSALYRMPLKVRGATVANHSIARRPQGTPCTSCRIQAYTPALHDLIPRDAVIELVSAGFEWVEGPLWLEGTLLFSDIPANRIYRWRPPAAPSVFLAPSGYSGSLPFSGAEPGSNGLTLDLQGRLVICEHGDRRITRLEADGSRTVLADRYAGRRLNSPNDAVFHPRGDLYFTDPPFGLPGQFDDPARELDFSGIYRRTAGGEVELLSRALKAPNGLAFSPDGATLYVTDVDPARPAWLAFPVRRDGRLDEPRVLRDARAESGPGRGAPDGLKVDRTGHLFSAGPGGVYVLSPTGELLGLLELGVPTGNVAWGDDGSTLYITASSAIYRIRTATAAAGGMGA